MTKMATTKMKVSIREYEEDPTLQGNEKALKQEFVFNTEDNHVVRLSRPAFLVPKAGLIRVLVELFLPIGYPHSVDESYLPYQLYDGLQGLCSYWRGVVSTKAVLEAAGVGNANASAFSAAMTWALRDGTGMLGGLIFSYVSSQYFDTHVKEFRLFADIINDVALTLDMLAPAAGDYSIWVLSLSTICKTMCGMSAGATKGRITDHFCRGNGNMADLTAKESTQETLVSLLGMIGGVVVARLLENAPPEMTWLLFWVLTVLHVWANYEGVMLLKLSTLNPERTQVLLREILKILIDDFDQDISQEDSINKAMEALPFPNDISESLWSSSWELLYPKIYVTKALDPKCLDCIGIFENEKYLIGYKSRRRVSVWLRVGATKVDELQAYTHAIYLQALLRERGKKWDPTLVKR